MVLHDLTLRVVSKAAAGADRWDHNVNHGRIRLLVHGNESVIERFSSSGRGRVGVPNVNPCALFCQSGFNLGQDRFRDFVCINSGYGDRDVICHRDATSAITTCAISSVSTEDTG